ncbi:MAG TPA: M48 family metalloprotease [Chlamydiales bacterium]|nr:M48 family metalloprotease [Chlamydiales bacterium]
MSSFALKANPYEMVLDYLPHIEHAVLSTILFPLRLAQRAGRIAAGAVQLFRPDLFFKKTYPEAQEITIESVDSLSHFAPKEKLEHFVRKVEEVSQKLKLKQCLKPYSSKEKDSNSSHGSNLFSFSPIPIFLNSTSLKASNAQIDAIVAHEASHSASNDKAKRYLLSCCLLIAEIGAYYSGYTYVLPLIEGAASLIENAYQRRIEMAADTKAMEILNTNEGTLESMGYHEKIYKEQRTKDETAFNADPKGYFHTKNSWLNCTRKLFSLFSQKLVVSVISPEGNYRKDLYHPPLSKRIVNALKFQPQVFS